MDSSAKTAINRVKLSSPMRYLSTQGLLQGNVLDYGCGKGFDADILCLRGYDPNWRNYPAVLKLESYDTITCNYVLNVLKHDEQRRSVLNIIHGLLKKGGKAYISVRADVVKEGTTKIGTWQGNISLRLPLLKATRQYRMYLLAKDGNEC